MDTIPVVENALSAQPLAAERALAMTALHASLHTLPTVQPQQSRALPMILTVLLVRPRTIRTRRRSCAVLATPRTPQAPLVHASRTLRAAKLAHWIPMTPLAPLLYARLAVKDMA